MKAASVPRSVPRAVVRVLWWATAVVWCAVCLAGRVLMCLGRVAGFVMEPVDELVTAWLGIAPVLPRLRRWWWRLIVEWRAYRSGAIEGEVLDGVWR